MAAKYLALFINIWITSLMEDLTKRSKNMARVARNVKFKNCLKILNSLVWSTRVKFC